MVETLISVTGTEITHDETAGLQNLDSTPTPSGDADDDDVLYSSIPTAFSSRLATLTSATPAEEMPIGAAASPGNVVTFSSAGTLGNIALTDASGDPLDGDDSGLTTTSGEKIYLYSDTANDNIVLGKTDDGTIVFAIYLEETGGTPPTGAKLWTVQYEAIDHGDDSNNFDSAKSLTDKVYITASEAQTFSFANAPSGQNLFMAFGNATQALLITGEDPANQSAGENVSSGNTVNSSQGGGTTTLGTDGQQIKAQKALVITFVSGANPDYLAGPNAGNGTGEPLSPTEATVEANIQFSGYVLADAAEFKISQMQPNNAAVTVEIAAYLTADASGTGYIDGNPLVQGDSQIAITGVQVIRGGVNVVGTLGVAVNLDGDGAVITGVRTGDIVKYVTDGDHNRVLIRNDQPTTGSGSNIAFDLGGFTLTEVDGDTDEIGSKIFFEDDGPSIAAGTNPNALIVDETDLNTNASGSFAGLFVPSFGTDGEAATGARLYELGIGVADANSGLVDSATGNAVWLFLSADKTTITGREGTSLADATNGDTVFVISVNGSTGLVSLDQQRAIVHPTTNPDESKTLADDVITLTAKATDGDTDYATRKENVGDRFTFKDDGPSAGTNTAVPLDDETAQNTRAAANAGGTGDATGTTTTVTGTLNHAFGNDTAGTVLLTGATLPVAGSFAQSLSADSKTLIVSQTQNGTSVDVLKIEVTNPATGAYTITHLAQVFHPTPGATEEDVSFTVNYRVTDKDTDFADSSITINVDDDTPTVTAGTDPNALTVDETDLSTNDSESFANLFTVSFGADGAAQTGPLVYALGIGAGGPNSGLVDTLSGDAIYLFASTDGTTITGKAGTTLLNAQTGPTAFVITVNATTGLVSLDQQRAVVHPNASDANDSKTLADNVITLTVTAKDGDLDTATRTENVGDRFTFFDDGPAIDRNAVDVPVLTTDDTEITDTAGPTSFAGLFTEDFGEDGFKDSDDNDVEDADATTYALGVKSPNVDSGVDDTLSGDNILLRYNAATKAVEGYLENATSTLAFTVSVDANSGAVTLTQLRAVVHNDPADPQESGASAATLAAADLITLTATITDGDGDTDQATADIGRAFAFLDDGPSIDRNAVAVPVLTTDDTEIPDTAGPTSFAGLFTGDFGEDGFKDSDDNNVEDADAIKYVLGVKSAGVDSGVDDTLSGDNILLRYDAMTKVVEGYLENDASTLAFTVSVDADSGAVTLNQLRAVVHNDPADSQESGASAATLAAADLITLTATITDGDLDTDFAVANIGQAFAFLDDGPSIDRNAVTVPVLTTDDTEISDTDGPTSFAGLFTGDFGEDGFKDSDDNDVEDPDAIKYVLGVKSAGVDSGLDDTLSGDNILLRYNATGKVVEGYLANAPSTLAFTVGVDADSGAVTLTQLRAVVHNDPADPQESGASAATLAAADLITLTATITDGDGDTDQATANIGRAFAFLDDGPSVTVYDATGTYAAGADGIWTPDPGEDGFESLGVTFDSFKIGALASQTTTAANSTFEKTGDYAFAGSITADFTDDGVANSQTVKFTLTFDPVNDTYDLSVTEVPTSVVTRDSSQGALKAGGPNPVQTLIFGGTEAGADDVLFFGVVATAPAQDVAGGDALATPRETPNDLEDLVYPGATDLNDTQIRAFLTPTNQIPTLINSGTQMNVSTSGIGINNNNLDGSGVGIQAGDESFVFNPEEVVDGVRVYIDNSVGGYDTATEDLYYRIFYTDGTVSGQQEVTSGMLSDALRSDPMVPSAARGGKYFEIDGGDKKIDAVQLTMGTGTIKVPVIQWSVETTFDPEDLQLDFTATLTDGDSDPDTDPFSVFLSETTT